MDNIIINKIIKKIAKKGGYEGLYENYEKKCKNKEYTLISFLKINELTYNEKLEIILNIVKKDKLLNWNIECAFSVLEIFEKKYTENKTLRNLLEYLKYSEKLYVKEIHKLNKIIIEDFKNIEIKKTFIDYACICVHKSVLNAGLVYEFKWKVFLDIAPYEAIKANIYFNANKKFFNLAKKNKIEIYPYMINDKNAILAGKNQEDKNIELLIKILENNI